MNKSDVNLNFPNTILLAIPIRTCGTRVDKELNPALKSSNFTVTAADFVEKDFILSSRSKPKEGADSSRLNYDTNVRLFKVPMDETPISRESGGYTFDGCHPNNEGNGFMAEKWFDAIKEHCI